MQVFYRQEFTNRPPPSIVTGTYYIITQVAMEDQPLSLQPENKQKKLTHEQEGGGQERGHEMLGGGGQVDPLDP